ncbi:hypothetical protein QUF94_13045 [Peribacillus sp. NJ4]|uniref:hypothetical protein n=1 Tax=Peribacillus TaxID=2675229 RepID=UPI0025A1D048|nr:hypothetical protein [Peribacillus sp. NJ4]MDM5212368.1 hypothetical protein [Peribacillus sp. NJ4]
MNGGVLIQKAYGGLGACSNKKEKGIIKVYSGNGGLLDDAFLQVFKKKAILKSGYFT